MVIYADLCFRFLGGSGWVVEINGPVILGLIDLLDLNRPALWNCNFTSGFLYFLYKVPRVWALTSDSFFPITKNLFRRSLPSLCVCVCLSGTDAQIRSSLHVALLVSPISSYIRNVCVCVLYFEIMIGAAVTFQWLWSIWWFFTWCVAMYTTTGSVFAFEVVALVQKSFRCKCYEGFKVVFFLSCFRLAFS